MGRPLANSNPVATTDRLLDAALLEFAAAGFDRARLADISAAAGISRPSLLYHFNSKSALYAATTARAFGSLADMIVNAVSARGSFRDRLRFLTEGFIVFARDNPAVCKLLMRVLVSEDDSSSRVLLLEQAAPLLDDITRFFMHDGDVDLHPTANLRAGLMTVVVTVLAKSAAGDLRAPLWGGINDDDIWMFVEHAMLRSQPLKATAPEANQDIEIKEIR